MRWRHDTHPRRISGGCAQAGRQKEAQRRLRARRRRAGLSDVSKAASLAADALAPCCQCRFRNTAPGGSGGQAGRRAGRGACGDRAADQAARDIPVQFAAGQQCFLEEVDILLDHLQCLPPCPPSGKGAAHDGYMTTRAKPRDRAAQHRSARQNIGPSGKPHPIVAGILHHDSPWTSGCFPPWRG